MSSFLATLVLKLVCCCVRDNLERLGVHTVNKEKIMLLLFASLYYEQDTVYICSLEIYIYYALLYMFTLYNVMNMLFNLSTKSLWSVCVCESHLTDHRTSNINLSGKIKCLIWSSAVRLYVILMTIMLNITITDWNHICVENTE